MANNRETDEQYVYRKFMPKGALITSIKRDEGNTIKFRNNYVRFIVVYRMNGETYRTTLSTQKGKADKYHDR